MSFLQKWVSEEQAASEQLWLSGAPGLLLGPEAFAQLRPFFSICAHVQPSGAEP